MTFRLRHEWTEGARLPAVAAAHPPQVDRPAASLASCRGCGLLRVVEGDRVAFVRRRADAQRVTVEEPPCVSGASFRAPW